jgi:integrase
MTFRECVDEAVPGMTANSRNEKHQRQFKDSLRKACTAFGDVSVAAIDSQMIVKFLTPIWNATPTSADRLRNRIERVLDWAKAKGFREGENPAAWKGNLEHMLFVRGQKNQRHYPALPYADLPAFMVKLRERNTTIAKALEFCILTGSRTDQIRDLKWTDIDLNKRLWIVPGEDMKAGFIHTVPLSDAAVGLLDALYQLSPHDPDDYVFPGTTAKRFSESGLLDTLHAMKVPVTPEGPVTVHGFRTTFADWARERGKFQPDMVEHALAHSVGTKVAQAYTRGTYLEERTKMMQRWGNYCAGSVAEESNVVPMHA